MNAASNGDKGKISLRLYSPLPERLEVGEGQFVVFEGECLAPDEHVASVRLIVDEQDIEAELSVIENGVSFWQSVFFSRDMTGAAVPVKVKAVLIGGEFTIQELGRIICEDVCWSPVDTADIALSKDTVAICMATYNPELDSFRRQIDSIRVQSHEHWLCIVNDDGTRQELWNQMQSCCSDDKRFVFYRNAENVGFYRNFETVLKRVPKHVDYVALSDQDDLWYPDKLTRLIGKLRKEDAKLAYSDMRIVNEKGNEIAPTYWVNRKNEYRNLSVVLVANTVTGAASVFRTELLNYLLPFPPRVGDAFHDHWLACVAMSNGTLAYVDAPLHSYYQYGDSVIGHCDFVRFSMKQRIASAARFVYRLLRPAVAGPLLRQKYSSALAIYRGECRRLRLVGTTIRRRCRVDAGRERQLRLFDGGVRSLVMLLVLHLKVLFAGQTTDDAELRLAMGELARMVERRRQKG